ncbi:MAG: hypothetical protein VYB61_04495 [Verrucomicrobiota bacterium]|nr:hypothetical protein [Verrucomicrobiota bacterium]
MSRPMIVIIAAAMLLDPLGILSAIQAATADEGSSRSRSGQFIVHGKDGQTRGAFCVFCEEVKGEVLKILGQPDRWKLPIVLQLKGNMSDVDKKAQISPKIYSLAGGGFRLQADIEISSQFSAEPIREEMIRLLLAELILRPHPRVDLKQNQPLLPEWLRVGLIKAVEHRRLGRPSSLFASIVKSENMVSITDVLFAPGSRKTSISTEMYSAACCSLVLALLGQDAGSMKMGRLISELAIYRGTSRSILARHFPETGKSGDSLERWWSSELVAMAQPTVKDILGPLESERALAASLKVRYVPSKEKVKEGGRGVLGFLRHGRGSGRKELTVDAEDVDPIIVDISEYRRFIELPQCPDILDDVEVKLLHLSYRAFPLHRPMIRDYQVVLQLLAKGKTSGLDAKLGELSRARVELAALAGQATDYVNWYEATQVERRSGAFNQYKSVFKDLQLPLPPRRDKLSRYLDQLDKEFRTD